jgi:hypothetical protein
MTSDERLRRVAILCCHFLRNLALYRAGWRYDVGLRRRVLRKSEQQFWRNANSNSLDICVLEWCKLFAREGDKHHWKRVVIDHLAFQQGLLRVLRKTPDEFATYTNEMLRYRDKFVAHLDDEPTMLIPRLRIARKGVSFLYDYLIQIEDSKKVLADAYAPACEFYRLNFQIGRNAYSEGEN